MRLIVRAVAVSCILIVLVLAAGRLMAAYRVYEAARFLAADLATVTAEDGTTQAITAADVLQTLAVRELQRAQAAQQPSSSTAPTAAPEAPQ